MKKYLILFLLLSLYSISYGVYLKDVPYELIQPNGEVLNVYITGDEFFRRVHDSNGYSIVEREDGWFCYAIYDAENDELIASEYVVSSNQQALLPMEKGLGISYEKYMEIRRAYFEPTGCDPSGAAKKSLLEDLANAKTAQQMNNIIICIGFSDTQGMTNNFNYVDGMYNTNANNNVRDYYDAMSYSKLDLVSHFYPPADGNVLRFYQDENPRNYYRPYNASSNTIGYSSESQQTSREHTLLRNAVNWVNDNWPVPTDLNLDINNDGECDFITFIIYGAVGGWSELLWPHKWNLYSTPWTYINGKRINAYNFELDGTSSYFNVGTFCHEGFHVLGAPDLYHYSAYTNLQAVGSWDVMEVTSNSKPQSMSAYMKLRYGRWLYNNNYTHINFPTAAINQTYEVFPFYTNDGSDPEKPIMYRIPMTGITTQYSVVEYRKRSGMNYDATSIPGEGLLIYRINTSISGNAEFNGTSVFDEVYLYRSGSTQTNGVYSNGALNQAPYNTSSGKTAFNSTTNPKPCQSNGTEETTLNINNILYDSVTDSYTFFYGNPTDRNMSIDVNKLVLKHNEGSTGLIDVTSNVLWRVSIPSEAADWLSASITKGLNSQSVEFTTLEENTTNVSRRVNVTFTGNNQTFTVLVIQAFEFYPVSTVTANIVDNNAVVEWTAPESLTSETANYMVYRLKAGQPEDEWIKLTENITELTYTDEDWSSLSWGEYQYAVKVVYEEDLESDAVFSNTVGKNMYIDCQIIISTNSGLPITAAKLSIWSIEDPENVFVSTINSNTANVPCYKRGYYIFKIEVYGYEIYTEYLGITDDGIQNVELIEIKYPVKEVIASIVDNHVVVEWEEGSLMNNFSSFEFQKTTDYPAYNVYRITKGQSEDELKLIAENITETQYVDTDWITLSPACRYQYAIKSVFGSGLSEAVLSNELYLAGYKVTVVAEEGGAVEIIGYENTSALVIEGLSVTVKAIANEKYDFLYWTIDGNTVEGAGTEYQFTVTEDVTLIAHFKTSRINKIEVEQFTIHPNPTSDILTVTRSTTSKSQIEIYTSAGLLVLTQSIENNETETNINVSALVSGAYMIKLIDEFSNSTQRFVKK